MQWMLYWLPRTDGLSFNHGKIRDDADCPTGFLTDHQA
jgi:hypothetical protein